MIHPVSVGVYITPASDRQTAKSLRLPVSWSGEGGGGTSFTLHIVSGKVCWELVNLVSSAAPAPGARSNGNTAEMICVVFFLQTQIRGNNCVEMLCTDIFVTLCIRMVQFVYWTTKGPIEFDLANITTGYWEPVHWVQWESRVQQL